MVLCLRVSSTYARVSVAVPELEPKNPLLYLSSYRSRYFSHPEYQQPDVLIPPTGTSRSTPLHAGFRLPGSIQWAGTHGHHVTALSRKECDQALDVINAATR